MSKPIIPETPPDYDRTRIVERPDGYYWREKGGKREYGPFATLIEAVEDMDYSPEGSYEPGETLEQALGRMETLEHLARVTLLARVLGEPQRLGVEEVDRLLGLVSAPYR